MDEANRTVGSPRTVRLEQVRQNNIVLEYPASKKEDRENSIFAAEYCQTAETIRSILQNNKEKQSRNSGGRERQDWSEYQTTIPFIGDRGTGKTSLMCTVHQELSTKISDRNRESGNPFLEAYVVDAPRCRFLCLDMIDVSTMKANENVMELILARMYHYLEEAADRPQRGNKRPEVLRGLYQQIDELARTFRELYRPGPVNEVESGLESLKKISKRQEAVSKFQKLVADFTREIACHIEDCGGDYHTCYLVVALDDVDMFKGSNRDSQNSHFSLMEHIYDYLRIPNLLVLLTFNERILQRNCMQHFRSYYFGGKPDGDLNPSEKQEIDELTRQFMSKLFPMEQRVYMPNFRYVDSAEKSNLEVYPSLGDKLLLKSTKKDKSLPVKTFMLRLIAQKTEVYFDSAGSKQHFFEPRNLRELGALFQVVHGWPDPEGNSMVIAENRQKLLNYLRNKYAVEHLNAEEYRAFLDLSAIPLLWQGRSLVDDIRRHRMYAVDEDAEGYLEPTDRDRWKYSYGELMHNLYYATRAKNEDTEKTLYSKAFVCSILGSQTVLLNQTLANNMGDSLRSFIGSSLGGRWANDMLPKIAVNDISQYSLYMAQVGSISLPVKSFLDFPLPLPKDVDEAGTKDWIQKLAEALFLLGAFFTSYPANGLKIRWEVKAPSKTGKDYSLHIVSDSEDSICFNVLNPFLNLHLFDDNGESPNANFTDNLCERLKRLFEPEDLDNKKQKLNDLWDGLQKTAEAVRADMSRIPPPMPVYPKSGPERKAQLDRYDSFKPWYEKFQPQWNGAVEKARDSIVETGKKAALPVVHMDMMYNILKRVANIYYHDIAQEASVDEVYVYMVQLYEAIFIELNKQDTFYGSEFAKNYRESLFYRVFTAESQDDMYNPYLRPIISEMMRVVIPRHDDRERITQSAIY